MDNGSRDGAPATRAIRFADESGSSAPPSLRPQVAPAGLRGAFALDLVLVHAPAVFDFRREHPLPSPFADVVPSTGQFEMYPVGLTSIAAYLESNGYNVRIVNLAYRMLRSESFDPVALLAKLRAPVFGIDLHWLPHVQGALAVAELIKRVHPAAAVLLGGLSASYYHRELVTLPHVDYVLRGDSTEEPSRQLLAALRRGTDLGAVENLTYRDDSGSVVANELSFVPADLDGIDVPAYDYILGSVLKYRDLQDVVPYLEWLKHPTTMVLNARGCPLDCAVCGGSRSAYRRIAARPRPAYRSPERLVDDVRTIAGFSRSPVFMVHDPRVGGAARARRLFELLAELRPANEMVFELFSPADDAFFEQVAASVPNWSLQITLESADEELRSINGKFAHSNDALEQTIARALDHGCHKLDLFFMVGLPHQTEASALRTVAFCEGLADRYDNDPRLQFYVAPLAPFLDPGSRAFEDPGLGYRLRFASLEDYRQAMLQPTWADTLSYETDAMSRDDIVRTTYRVAHGLNELKHDRGQIDETTYRSVHEHLAAAERLLGRHHDLPDADDDLARLRGHLSAAGAASLCGSDELRWSGADGLRLTPSMLVRLTRGLLALPLVPLRRLRRRFDGAVWRPRSIAVPEPFLQPSPALAAAVPDLAGAAAGERRPDAPAAVDGAAD